MHTDKNIQTGRQNDRQTDRQTNMALSTRFLILIQYIPVSNIAMYECIGWHKALTPYHSIGRGLIPSHFQVLQYKIRQIKKLNISEIILVV